MKWLRRSPRNNDAGPADEPTAAPEIRDPISERARRGSELGNAARRPTRADLEEARAILANLKQDADLAVASEIALAFVERYPSDERFQTIVARILERKADQGAIDAWAGIAARFPQSHDPFIRVLRWTRRLNGPKAAAALRDSQLPRDPGDPDRLMLYGRSCLELQEYDEAEEVFDAVLDDHRSSARTLTQLVTAYRNQRQPLRAHSVLETAKARFGSNPALLDLGAKLEAELLAIRSSLPDLPETSTNLQNEIVKRIFSLALARRPQVIRQQASQFLGSTILINAGLGAGGAERQFVNTVIGLQRAAETGTPIAGIDVLGPVQVVCRSLASRAQGDFFVPLLHQHGLGVLEYTALPEFGGRVRNSTLRDFIQLLDYLPPQMRVGLVRLTDFLRYAEPDVVHIWQDGTILATGLAAVLAGVPRIVLGVRSLPPVDRPERHRPEYEQLYRSVLAVPGVTLVANSQMAANRYASWLEQPQSSVHVIPNGVAPLPSTADAMTALASEEFDARASHPLTLGSVMRFDENKRPYLWLDTAAAIVKRNPDVRFILVGDGPLLAGAQHHALRLGLADRVLFTGRSHHVGYWLTRMDAFLLLSEHEGLPNVLIEAQLAGVPVVTTPAGGAPEAVLQGVTGSVLDSTTTVDPEATAETVLSWLKVDDARRQLAETTRDWAQSNFSLDRMLELTAALYLS